ncbi:MAG: P-loop NTPase [Desulfosarcina sp.]|nr:P-loop NTPase [Desulfobacterales bacterium]
MEDRQLKIKLSVQDTPCAVLFQDIIQRHDNFALAGHKSSARLDLLIYELRDEPLRELQQVKGLLDRGEIKDVFIYSTSTDPDVLLNVIKIGLKHYFTDPLDKDDIIKSLDAFVREVRSEESAPVQKLGRIFNVIGSKGGVGSTTVAVNLATSISMQKGQPSVALMDMNTLFGDIPLFMDIKSKFHWGEITKNIDRLDDTFLMKVLDRHPTGVHVLTSPGYLNGHIEPTPAIIERLLSQMSTMFDFIIVDTGQSTSDTSLKITQMAEAVLLISTLSLPCLANTNKLIQSYLNMGYAGRDKIKIIVNRFLKKSEVSLKDAEESINQELFWVVPNDYATSMSAINQGKTLLEQFPRSPLSKSFQELAETLAGVRTKSKKTRKWLFF